MKVVSEEDEENEDDNAAALKNEVLMFSTLCEKCSHPVETKMKVTDIPHFKVSNFI